MNEVTQADLLPCPLCNHDMSLVTWIGNEEGSLEPMEGPLCPCGLQGPMYPTREQAVIAWNTRPATLSDRDAVIEEARWLFAQIAQMHSTDNGNVAERCMELGQKGYALLRALKGLGGAGLTVTEGGVMSEGYVDGDLGASPLATGLAGAEAPEPPSRLGPSDGIPSAGCRNCSGCGWVCENHRDTPWPGLAANECCGGAGSPCPVCCPELDKAPLVHSIAQEARRYAAYYEPGSDGRNTFTMFAEFVETRAIAQAIEARRAATAKTGAVEDESVVGNADAPNLSGQASPPTGGRDE